MTPEKETGYKSSNMIKIKPFVPEDCSKTYSQIVTSVSQSVFEISLVYTSQLKSPDQIQRKLSSFLNTILLNSLPFVNFCKLSTKMIQLI